MSNKLTLQTDSTLTGVGISRTASENQHLQSPNPDSIARAKAACFAERQAVLDRLGPEWFFTPGGQLARRPVRVKGVDGDDALVNLRLQNWMWAALYSGSN